MSTITLFIKVTISTFSQTSLQHILDITNGHNSFGQHHVEYIDILDIGIFAVAPCYYQ